MWQNHISSWILDIQKTSSHYMLGLQILETWDMTSDTSMKILQVHYWQAANQHPQNNVSVNLGRKVLSKSETNRKVSRAY